MSSSLHSDRLSFTRHSERRTSDDKLLDQLEFIAWRALDGRTGRGKGWTYEVGRITARDSGIDWTFTSWIRFYRERPASPNPERAIELESQQRATIYQFASATGHHAKFGRNPWIADLSQLEMEEEKERKEGKVDMGTWGEVINNLDGDLKRGLIGEITHQLQCSRCGKSVLSLIGGECSDCKTNNPVDPIDPLTDSDPIPLSSISSIQPGDYFSHLFGLDAQIRILLSAIQAAADSAMRNRFHSLLHGQPGAGKTDILLSTHKLLTSLGISCLAIDATSTTEAGMRKLLLDEDSILPEVILVEEIEKALHSFRLLLGIMDDRGTVSELNYRRTSTRKVPALILASANDYNMLTKIDSGALLSRFSNEIECPLPDRDICAKILAREINLVKNGNLAWIEPTLVFCCDQRGIFDPRQLKRICLSGKDRLLSGEYQADLEVTMREKVSSRNRTTVAAANLDLFK